MASQNLEPSAASADDGQPRFPTQDEIETLAYYIWEKDGRREGHSAEHWLQAEALLQAQRLQAT